MNENNLNNNVQNGMGGVSNVNVGGVPPVNNVNVNQGVMPNANPINQNVNPVDMNQGVAQNVNSMNMNQGVMPSVNSMNQAVNSMDMNQGVTSSANSVDINQGIMQDASSINQGGVQSINPVDMNQGVMPNVNPVNQNINSMNMNQGVMPNTVSVDQGMVGGTANNVQPPKKKSSASSIIILILFIVAVCGGGFYAYKTFFQKDSKPADVDNDNTPTTTAADESDSGSTVPTGIKAGGVVTVGNYTYTVPSSLFYQVQDAALFVSDSTTAATYVIGFLPIASSYDELKNNTDDFKAGLADQGIAVDELVVSTVGNREYILSSVTFENEPMALAVTKLDDKNLMLMRVSVVSEDALKNSFGTIENILTTIKTTSSFASETTSEKIEDKFKNSKKSDFSIQGSKVGVNVLK